MYQTLLLSSTVFLLHLMMASPQLSGHHHGRRVCGHELRQRVVMTTESYIQPVHKPYITLCQDHRLCSTYKTVYRVATRQVSKAAPPSPHSYPECCPGWRRFHSHSCNQAVCGQSCVNGGTCLRPNHCVCPLGWTGQHCQTDMDECSEQQPCPQSCVNTAGSYRCVCTEGFILAEDGRSCHRLTPNAPSVPLPPHHPTSTTSQDSRINIHQHTPHPRGSDQTVGLVQNVTEEVQSLRNRVELLEQKLQLVLAPFNSLFPVSLDDGLSEKTTFLSHSFQQLDRIDSLSEQIGFLEERLGTCGCQEN